MDGSYDTYRKLYSDEPDNDEFRRSLARAARLGGMQKARQRKYEEGVARVRESIDLQLRVPLADMGNEDRDYLGGTYRDLATLLKFPGSFRESFKELSSARTIHEELLAKDPNNPSYIRSMAMVHVVAAGGHIELLEYEQALTDARVAADAFTGLCKHKEVKKTDPYQAVVAINYTGQALAKMKRKDEALQYYQAAIPQAEAILSKVSEELDARVGITRLLGTAAEGMVDNAVYDPEIVAWCDRSLRTGTNCSRRTVRT